jgi:hypothetical protein
MHFNTDAPDEHIQGKERLMANRVCTPNDALYRHQWDIETSPTLDLSLAEPGRPRAHLEYVKAWDYHLGQIPLDPDSWYASTNTISIASAPIDHKNSDSTDALSHLALDLHADGASPLESTGNRQ